MADQIEAAAAAATVTLAKMTADYEAGRQLERDEAELARLENDPHHQNARLTSEAARQNEAAVKARIAVAKAVADAAVASQVLSDAQRVDLALKGEVFSGPQPTTDGQIPASDFASVVAADIALGVPESMVKSFYSTGLSDGRLGHVASELWLERFRSDAEMQREFMAGNPEMQRKFRVATIAIAGKHPNVTAEEERAARAHLIAAWGW
jgi:hypothetical protein